MNIDLLAGFPMAPFMSANQPRSGREKQLAVVVWTRSCCMWDRDLVRSIAFFGLIEANWIPDQLGSCQLGTTGCCPVIPIDGLVFISRYSMYLGCSWKISYFWSVVALNNEEVSIIWSKETPCPCLWYLSFGGRIWHKFGDVITGCRMQLRWAFFNLKMQTHKPKCIVI